ETKFADYPHTQALFSHFTRVRRSDSLPAFQSDETPPYAPDDAALHHVFDGGWLWALRFDNGTTSAGVAVTDALAHDIGLADGEAAWHRLLTHFPSIAEQFADAQPIRPFAYSPRLSFRTARAAGPGWAMLPSAAAFVDPLFSTGFPLTLLGIARLGRILGRYWDTDALDAQLSDYGATTLAEADTVADLISGCYAGMADFPAFSSLSMFYFAAASFSEMARRLDSPRAPQRFLAADNTQFLNGMRQSTAQVRTQGALDARQTTSRVACLNIAGLCDPAKRRWYGVDLEDVVRGADKLGLCPDAVRHILRTAPWAQMPAD
ncbi:MAG: tryptophan 7-halogenase, partial [Armatimonadota bacterium]|nr:tryptophan 7-halogenase [Armatimonadota bacterium]